MRRKTWSGSSGNAWAVGVFVVCKRHFGISLKWFHSVSNKKNPWISKTNSLSLIESIWFWWESPIQVYMRRDFLLPWGGPPPFRWKQKKMQAMLRALNASCRRWITHEFHVQASVFDGRWWWSPVESTGFRWWFFVVWKQIFKQSHRIHGTGIFTYIYHIHQSNVGRHTIHGSYRNRFVYCVLPKHWKTSG